MSTMVTYRILLSTLRGLRLDVHLAILLLSREDLGVQQKLEALLRQRSLELLPAMPMSNNPILNPRHDSRHLLVETSAPDGTQELYYRHLRT